MTTADLQQAVRTRLDWLARPCAVLELGGSAVDARQSMVGGHPYLPPGAPWPESASGPYAFVVQINFSDVPPLAGFPTAGLLQWFVEPEDTFGLTFDETAGAAGFHVRWWDASAGAASTPLDAPLPPTGTDGYSPVTVTEPRALTFRTASSLPEWDGLPQVAQEDPIWGQLAEANGEDPEEAAFGYAEFARGPAVSFGRSVVGQIGGFASFVQWDPRPGRTEKRNGRYPAVGEAGWPLLVELVSASAWEWGDVGVAHLFADPAAVGRGDLSSVTYHWDCH